MQPPDAGSLREKITLMITEEVRPGDHASPGGHVGSLQLDIHKITEPARSGDHWVVECYYDTILENEFTVYPDNPPRVSSYRAVFKVTDDGSITRESKTMTHSSDFDPETWLDDL